MGMVSSTRLSTKSRSGRKAYQVPKAPTATTAMAIFFHALISASPWVHVTEANQLLFHCEADSVCHGARCRSLRGSPLWPRRFPRHVFPARNVRYRGIEPSRQVYLSEMLLLRRERRKDRSCPKSPAKAVSTCGNIPETSDRASHSTRNPEIGRAESLCSPGVQGVRCPACTTPAERSPDSLRLRCTASAFLRLSKCFGGECPDSLRSVPPSTFGLDPMRRPGLLRKHSHSG